nr:immunoglobulin heavy chain junction region [Macaca mulatta]MOW33040.1 immunoglobulin heavy chain junction region [Macaca mulatta]
CARERYNYDSDYYTPYSRFDVW